MPPHDTNAFKRIKFGRLFGTFLLATALVALGGQAGALTEADGTPDGSTEESRGDESVAEQEAENLREGATVYAQTCASCHQAGGVGLEGQFPPLIDNPNTDDATYLETVITNGRQGELEVAGVTYDGVMPSFSTLSDDDTGAVIAFVQNDFIAPAVAATPPLGPVASTERSALAKITYLLSFLIVAGLILLVFASRILGENDRLNMPWLDAWLKTAVIVSGVILLTVVIPDWAIRRDEVTKLSRFSQDLIGVSLWGFGIVVVTWSLWYAHRRSRV